MNVDLKINLTFCYFSSFLSHIQMEAVRKHEGQGEKEACPVRCVKIKDVSCNYSLSMNQC